MLLRAPALSPLLEVFYARPQHLFQDRRRRARFGSHMWDGVRRADPTFDTRCTVEQRDRKSTRLNSSHLVISYAVFCLKKKKKSDKYRYTAHTMLSK